MKDLKYWIWFSRLQSFNPKYLLKLLEEFKNPQELFNKSEEQLINAGLKEKQIKEILKKEYRLNLDKYIAYMKENNIELITIYDKEYPEGLKEIYDPPVLLYIKGNKKILSEKGIAIVGCRKCTTYGSNIAKKLAYDISSNNINIISGLARGIDTSSHVGALNAKGKTIAVVGCGLDRVYPEENTKIFNEIIKENGAIISEYVIGTKPEAKNFPRRNRIISGLSSGVVVIEAKDKSGTLITADFALDQGRDVYAIPGDITKPNSFGTNKLIKQGAKLVTNAEDILEDFR